MADYIDGLQIGTDGTAVPLRDTGARELIANCAPAGYGLGVMAISLRTISDANDATNTGWYKTGSSTANALQDSGILRVEARENGYIKQTEIRASTGDERTRTCIGGTWGEWEWVNPPMVVGVEYRTAERWKGKPVYAKAVDLGTLPARSGLKSVLIGGGASAIVSVTGTTSGGSAIPYQYGLLRLIDITATKTQVHVSTGDNDYSDYSDNTGTAYVKYTKD